MSFTPIYVVDGARTPFLKAAAAPVLSPPPIWRSRPGAVSCCGKLSCPPTSTRSLSAVPDLRRTKSTSAGSWPPPGLRPEGAGLDGDAQLRQRHAGARFGHCQYPVRALPAGPGRRRRCAVPGAALYSDAMVPWFAGMMQAGRPAKKPATSSNSKPSALLSPVIGLLKGLTDPSGRPFHGQTVENLAWRFGIGRGRMDGWQAATSAPSPAGRAPLAKSFPWWMGTGFPPETTAFA